MAFQKEKTKEWGIDPEVCRIFKSTISYIIDNEASLFRSWILFMKGQKNEYFLNLRRIIPVSDLTSEYPELIDLIARAHLKWRPDLDFEYKDTRGTHSKYIIIEE